MSRILPVQRDDTSWGTDSQIQRGMFLDPLDLRYGDVRRWPQMSDLGTLCLFMIPRLGHGEDGDRVVCSNDRDRCGVNGQVNDGAVTCFSSKLDNQFSSGRFLD